MGLTLKDKYTMTYYFLSNELYEVSESKPLTLRYKVQKDAFYYGNNPQGYIVSELRDILSIESVGMHVYTVEIDKDNIIESKRMYKLHLVSEMMITDYLGVLPELKHFFIATGAKCSLKDGLTSLLDNLIDCNGYFSLNTFKDVLRRAVDFQYVEHGYTSLDSNESITIISSIYAQLVYKGMTEHISHLDGVTANFNDEKRAKLVFCVFDKLKRLNKIGENAISFFLDRLSSDNTDVMPRDYVLAEALSYSIKLGLDQYLPILEDLMSDYKIKQCCKEHKAEFGSKCALQFMSKHGVDYSKCTNSIIKKVVSMGDMDIVRTLIADGFNPTSYNNLMYKLAVSYERAEMVEFLEVYNN